ncbi:MAG: hypothetical protein AB1304_10685 [Bacteroidota bacterium]
MKLERKTNKIIFIIVLMLYKCFNDKDNNTNNNVLNKLYLDYSSANINNAFCTIESLDTTNNSLLIINLHYKYNNSISHTQRKIFLKNKNSNDYKIIHFMSVLDSNNVLNVDTDLVIAFALKDTIVFYRCNEHEHQFKNNLVPPPCPPDNNGQKYSITKLSSNLFRTRIELFNDSIYFEEIYYDSLFNIKEIIIKDRNNIKLRFIGKN